MELPRADPRARYWDAWLWQAIEESKRIGLGGFGLSEEEVRQLDRRMRGLHDELRSGVGAIELSLQDLRTIRECGSLVKALIGFEMHMILGIDHGEFEDLLASLDHEIEGEIRLIDSESRRH